MYGAIHGKIYELLIKGPVSAMHTVSAMVSDPVQGGFECMRTQQNSE